MCELKRVCYVCGEGCDLADPKAAVQRQYELCVGDCSVSVAAITDDCADSVRGVITCLEATACGDDACRWETDRYAELCDPRIGPGGNVCREVCRNIASGCTPYELFGSRDLSTCYADCTGDALEVACRDALGRFVE